MGTRKGKSPGLTASSTLLVSYSLCPLAISSALSSGAAGGSSHKPPSPRRWGIVGAC